MEERWPGEGQAAGVCLLLTIVMVSGPGPRLRCVGGWGWWARGTAENNKDQGCSREAELDDSEFVLVGCTLTTLFALALYCIVAVAIWRLLPLSQAPSSRAREGHGRMRISVDSPYLLIDRIVTGDLEKRLVVVKYRSFRGVSVVVSMRGSGWDFSLMEFLLE